MLDLAHSQRIESFEAVLWQIPLIKGLSGFKTHLKFNFYEYVQHFE